MTSLQCACPCGHTTFEVTQRPFARFFCHCTICQTLYKLPFADVTVVAASAVKLVESQKIQFHKYRAPPALNRGTCAACGAPIAGFMGPRALGLAFVTGRNYLDQRTLPKPEMHIFYHSRVQEAADGLPTHSGYFGSELAVIGLIARRIFSKPVHE